MQNWRENAVCKNSDPEKFFPERGETPGFVRDLIKTTCDICTVRNECLEFSITNNIVEGIWGGVSGHTRRQLRQRYLNGTIVFKDSVMVDLSA